MRPFQDRLRVTKLSSCEQFRPPHRLVTAPPETQAELRSMVARPTVLCIDYDPPPEYFLTDLHLAILDKVVVRDE